jgi:hypothetical protein
MNPEFQRNLWLEAAPRRVAGALTAVALIYGAVALAVRGEMTHAAPALAMSGLVVFLVCAGVWASRAAGASVLNEIAQRTWDFQRLSALTPWQMTWGKLFGATSLAWICALTGIAAMLPAMAQGGSAAGPWQIAFFLALALLLQAVSFGAALIGVRKARAEGRMARNSGVLGGLVIGLFLLSSAAGSAGFQRGVGMDWISHLLGGKGFIPWWSGYHSAEVFRALATAVFAAFALAGAWRLMRLELQMRNGPLVWPAFLAFLAVFAGGFPFRQGGLSASLLTAGLAVALCAYAAAFAEPADRVRLRRFARAVRQGAMSAAGRLAPTALTPLVFSVILIGAALASGGLNPPQLWQGAALTAFVARDLGVIAYFRLGPQPQRGDLSAVVALALLYAVGGIVGRAIAQETGAALFAPLPDAPMASLVSGLVQAGLAWVFAARRLSGPQAASASPQGS